MARTKDAKADRMSDMPIGLVERMKKRDDLSLREGYVNMRVPWPKRRLSPRIRRRTSSIQRP